MNLRFAYQIALGLCLKASITQAVIPEAIQAHIDRDFNPSIQVLNNLGYSDEQRDLILDRYVDGLSKLYKISLSPDEVRDFLKARLAAVGPVTGTAYFAINQSSFTPLSNMSEIKAFIEKFVQQQSTNNAFINVPYQGIVVPLFVERDHRGVHISLVGIRQDSTKRSWPESPFTGVPGAMACLDLKIYGELDILNAEYKACPIPKGASGKYLLTLAEEIARGLGSKNISGSDRSRIRCEKNGETTSLARWSVFHMGKTWYGLQGYRSSEDDDDITRSHKSFLLSVVKDELDKTDQEAMKRAMFEYAGAYEKKQVENDFSAFDRQKQKFDAAVADFISAKGKIAGMTLGQFFSWLWARDCALYIDIEGFLFNSRATKHLSLQKLPRLPSAPSKAL